MTTDKLDHGKAVFVADDCLAVDQAGTYGQRPAVLAQSTNFIGADCLLGPKNGKADRRPPGPAPPVLYSSFTPS
jgi:hypothetical protein